MKRFLGYSIPMAILALLSTSAFAQTGVAVRLRSSANCDAVPCVAVGQVCVEAEVIQCCDVGTGFFEPCGSAGGGVTNFLGLTDTPDTFVSHALKVVRVNAGETALEFSAAAGGSPGGSNTQVQFNDSGAFGGDAGLTYNKTTDVLTAGTADADLVTVSFTPSGGDYNREIQTNNRTFWANSSGGGAWSNYATWDTTDNRWEAQSTSAIIGPTVWELPYTGLIALRGATVQSYTAGDPLTLNTILLLDTSVSPPVSTMTGNLAMLTAGATVDGVDLDSIPDGNVSNTLTSSLFVGAGSTTTAIDLATAEVGGTLPVVRGGTGIATLTDGRVLVTTATDVIGTDAGLAYDDATDLLTIGAGVTVTTGNVVLSGAGATVDTKDLDLVPAFNKIVNICPSGCEYTNINSACAGETSTAANPITYRIGPGVYTTAGASNSCNGEDSASFVGAGMEATKIDVGSGFDALNLGTSANSTVADMTLVGLHSINGGPLGGDNTIRNVHMYTHQGAGISGDCAILSGATGGRIFLNDNKCGIVADGIAFVGTTNYDVFASGNYFYNTPAALDVGSTAAYWLQTLPCQFVSSGDVIDLFGTYTDASIGVTGFLLDGDNAQTCATTVAEIHGLALTINIGNGAGNSTGIAGISVPAVATELNPVVVSDSNIQVEASVATTFGAVRGIDNSAQTNTAVHVYGTRVRATNGEVSTRFDLKGFDAGSIIVGPDSDWLLDNELLTGDRGRNPRGSAPSACTVGDRYTNTSGVAYFCRATNTWDAETLIAATQTLTNKTADGGDSGAGTTRPSGSNIIGARTANTDCTTLTDGKQGEVCVDEDDGASWTCIPTAGDCSGAEWKRRDDSGGAPDIDAVTGQANWGTAATKEIANLTINGVEVDFEGGAAEGFPRLAQSATPPSGACDAAGEAGRLYFDTDQAVNEKMFVCLGAGGWERVGGAGGGGFTSWLLDGDNNSPQTITDGNEALMVGGSGIDTTAAVTDQVTFVTDSTEQAFLASGALTCGASTNGKVQVHTTPLQYCDNAGTPALQYASYGNSSGESTAAANDSVVLITDTTGNFVGSVTGGAGVTASAAGEGTAVTVDTASGEENFLASGALTCGASTRGKAQVHTTPLQYCDNAGTPALQYAAYGDSSGNSTSAGNNSVLLATDTTGTFVNNAADGSGIDVTGTVAEDYTATINLLYTDTLGGDPAMNSDECRFSTDGTGGGLICEGAADTIEGLLAWAPTTSDRTLTLPDASDTLVGKATTDILTGKTLDAEGTGNVLTTVSKVWQVAATCQNATAFANFDTPTTNTPAATCVTGTNTQKAYLDFDQTTDESVQGSIMLPADVVGAPPVIDVTYKWLTTATTGSVTWCTQLICVADVDTGDPAFPAQASGLCVSDAAKGTTNQYNDASDTGITATGCAAGELMYFRLSRDPDATAGLTDDLAADARLVGFELTIRRAQ